MVKETNTPEVSPEINIEEKPEINFKEKQNEFGNKKSIKHRIQTYYRHGNALLVVVSSNDSCDKAELN